MQPRSGAFTIDIIKRILNVLHEQGRIKRTNLAGKVGLNYQGCMRYIKFLSMLKWVDFDQDGHVTISLIGKQFRHILNEGEMYAGQIDSSIFDIAEQIAHKKKSGQETALTANVLTGIASSRPSSSQSTKIKTSQNILLVDDDESILLTFKKFLQSEGYTVTALSDAKKAMEHFTVASSSPAGYDLVITDIRMSPLNGLLLHQAIKALDQKVKVIFVTALDAAEELTSIYGIPSNYVVKKPVAKENFIRAVKLALHDAGSYTNPSAPLAANQTKPPF